MAADKIKIRQLEDRVERLERENQKLKEYLTQDYDEWERNEELEAKLDEAMDLLTSSSKQIAVLETKLQDQSERIAELEPLLKASVDDLTASKNRIELLETQLKKQVRVNRKLTYDLAVNEKVLDLAMTDLARTHKELMLVNQKHIDLVNQLPEIEVTREPTSCEMKGILESHVSETFKLQVIIQQQKNDITELQEQADDSRLLRDIIQQQKHEIEQILVQMTGKKRSVIKSCFKALVPCIN